MSFSDPQTVSIGGVATSLPRVAAGVNSGAFSSADGTVKLSVSSQNGKRIRRQIRLDHQKYAADPTNSTINVPRSMTVYIVVDTPLQGYDLTEQEQLVMALTDYLEASSGARVAQLLGGEN